MPAHLKPPGLRQRRNKKTEAAELSAPLDILVPSIPNPDKRKWHKLTKSWRKHIWESPMSTRYLRTDKDALGFMAILVDDFFKATTSELRQKLMAEIRQWGARFGLSNWDRNRMDWSITENPENKPRPQSASGNSGDPRKVLKFK